ncbi:Hypothetical protein FORC64_p250 (plasmid) [Escherichia coli]|nr:Hypothetical protein FORC64_p250 [Escherichia coli]
MCQGTGSDYPSGYRFCLIKLIVKVRDKSLGLIFIQHQRPFLTCSGSADPSLPSVGQISQDVVFIPADITLYAVFIPVFASQSSAAEKITSLIH